MLSCHHCSSAICAFAISVLFIRRVAVGVVVFLVLQGCQYPLDEDNFQEKTIPDPSAIDLSQFSNEDTLFIPVTTDFSISVVNYEKRIIYEARAYVDGGFLHRSNGLRRLDFSIDPQAYSSGVHTLKIVFELSTGSGSLADMVNAEKLAVSKEWKFEVDAGTPSMVNHFDAYYDDGAIRVEWSEYSRKNFSRYKLAYSSSYQDFKDIHTTSFIDTTYVGGERSYSLQVYNQQNYSSSPSSKVYNDDGLRIAEIRTADHDFNIKWNRSKYYNAFKSYIISDWKTAAPLVRTSIMDTSIVLSAVGIELGFAEEVSVTTVGKAYDPTASGSLYGYPTQKVKVYQGKKVIDHVVTQYLVSNSSVYTRAKGKVWRLDADNLDTLATTDQLIDILKVSRNGEYAYSAYSSNITKRNPLTLATEKVFSINTLIGQNNLRVTGLFVSDDNKIALESWDNLWIIDMNTNSIIHHGSASHNVMNLSADFSLFFDGVRLYGYNAGSYTTLMSLLGAGYKVEFNSNFEDEAIIFATDSKKVTIIKPWTNTIVREFFIKDQSSGIIVDEKSNLALFIGGSRNNIYDLTTGHLKMDLGYTSTGYIYYTLFNNHLYRNSYFVSLDHYQP